MVWDLGGVLLRWDPIVLLRDALAAHPDEPVPPGLLPPGSMTPQALAPVVFQDFTPDSDWSVFDRGELDVDALASRIGARTGLGAGLVRAVLDGIPPHLEFVPGTVELLDRVQEAGHRLVYLSNMPFPYVGRLLADPRFTGWFSDGVFSSLVHRVKPEPEIYRIAADTLGLGAGPVLMIDDRPVNLVPARARGWAGLHFRGAGHCAAELERTGWL